MNLQEAITSSPALFPLNLDSTGTLVQLMHLSESEYAAASFLDNRLLQPNTRHATISWVDLRNASEELEASCNFIFHISHAGSTLISRLLGSHPSCFAIREPAILRLLGKGQYADRMMPFLRLWSRTFRSDQRTLIKATSFVSEIASELLQAIPSSLAILMFVPPATFLPGLLDGAMSDIDAEVCHRLHRIQKKGFLLGLNVTDLSPGENVAMSWLSEMISLAEVAACFPDRVLWLNFDRFLEQSETHLNRCFGHLGLRADSAAILSGSIMHRYAKKPEIKYDSSFRAGLLAQSAKKFSDEVARGLDWLHKSEPAAVRNQFKIDLS